MKLNFHQLKNHKALHIMSYIVPYSKHISELKPRTKFKFISFLRDFHSRGKTNVDTYVLELFALLNLIVKPYQSRLSSLLLLMFLLENSLYQQMCGSELALVCEMNESYLRKHSRFF